MCSALLVVGLLFTHVSLASAFTNQVLERGDQGSNVVELQARLQYISFYKGKIDGQFGYGTYWALRNFQQKYGLTVDGIAGSRVKNKLVTVSQYNQTFVESNLKAGRSFTYYGGVPLNQQVVTKKGSAPAAGSNAANTPQSNLPQGYSKSDIDLMANAVYGESRGEPYVGQVAVSAVIINRVADPRFPKTISDVIFQPGAFTAVSDGQIWLTPNNIAKKAVMDAVNGWDPTNGALYYFNPDTATSAWIWSRPQLEKIGKHIFCK
ncbi:MAG: spore cortex-lytic enzyme [Sporolactobacillus sp.]